MYTAAGLAKKYGLEQYLERPAELNELIFNLLLLQETMQLEGARKRMRDERDTKPIVLRRTAYGKFVAACTGDEKYRYAVETAFKTATDVLAVFQHRRFVKTLRSIGVPEDKITEFCQTVTLEDDTHCIDQE